MHIPTRHTPKISARSPLGDLRPKGFVRLNTVAAVALLCAGMLQLTDVRAMALGRVIVQSPLGAPLRAEVEVLEISKEEAESLSVGLGSAEAFQLAGMEFNAALTNVKVTLQRSANGRAFLKLTGSSPVNVPFLDLVLEANWKDGRVTRDYSLLFDPPNLQPSVSPIGPIVVPSSNAVATPMSSLEVSNSMVVSPTPMPTAEMSVRASKKIVTESRPLAVSPEARNDRLRVKRGDTAGSIAANNLSADVSLDQMLVALLRTNPNAFINGNINLIKAGAVLSLPDASAATAVATDEARKIITAQSRDFNEFRRRLAERVPQAPAKTANREAKGQIQAEVKEEKSVVRPQDKLTVSKGATPGQSETEDQIAKEKITKETSDRAAEITRNIEELSEVGKPAGGTDANPAPTVASTPAVESGAAPSLALPAAVSTQPLAEVSPADPTTTAEPTATQAPNPSAAAEPSFLDELLENPMITPVVGGLLALLVALGLYGFFRRKKTTEVDSSFIESRLQTNSFFGSSGGQRIDTKDAAASGSSMVYSHSQLDAADDVDPVAEADVYLAYGRDLQAEEILKEAMRNTPTRVAIHGKLLEIYAKRRDAKGFEVVATEVFELTRGTGTDWAHACDLGKELDPTNPLYKPSAPPQATARTAHAALNFGGTIPFSGNNLTPNNKLGDKPNQQPDIDLDLDQPQNSDNFSKGNSQPQPLDTQKPAGDPGSPSELGQRAPNAATAEPMAFDLDFQSDFMPLERINPEPSDLRGSAPVQPTPDTHALTRTFYPGFNSGSEQVPEQVSTQAASRLDSDLMSFDLNDITLDLSDDQLSADTATSLNPDNQLETKLSLANEFRAIGDMEGARSLAEEVMAESTGSLKAKASVFLANLA